jgi:hypothetical protein
VELAPLADAGLVQHVIAAVRGDDLETLRLFAERVIPAVREHAR